MTKAEQARQLADDALKKLASSLALGQSQSLTAYLTMLGRFHDYSFGNVMLIMAQRPDATRVAGFRGWKNLGRHVIKGEKGIVIRAPMVFRDDDSDRNESTVRFKAVHVFDVLQTDGDALPEPAHVTGDPGPHTHHLKAFVASKGIELHYAEDLNGADGRSSGGTITLRQDLDAGEEFSVLVHELAHELLHHGGAENRPSKVVRETEAEAVAFVVSQAIGLHAGDAASDYIQLYQGTNETLVASLDRIQRTAKAIIEAVAIDQPS